ncbi:DUF1059 domain-containing protein [Streptomyces sp. adm13(2018)]|uniref:DUF1059 domain-containing protein n=1 Tax=unclassified Streptomyces TaxID=2593676 RepID=UPI0011CE86FA|nr:DUF1059 domain-containing protein [Streptomyces sp. adm13(2018)]MYS10386.1 DUF1059 domain-containing protein [Streptomyces sp. SID6041]TXS11179.1 DUF1059 domain-containing protein [Streptomyces sp. adm13(2018)]
MARKATDCRDTPSVSGCSLYMAGEEEELVRAAVQHVVTVHEHQDSPELREEIRASMKDPLPGT